MTETMGVAEGWAAAGEGGEERVVGVEMVVEAVAVAAEQAEPGNQYSL